MRETVKLIKNNRRSVDRLTAELMEKRRLSEAEIEMLLKG
jgi:ATP-dependent Zn protease